MANPPPYANITGISRAAMKDNAQETLADYNGNARPGELVVNLVTDPPVLYVGNNLGQLTQISTWATLSNKNNASGPDNIALGRTAGSIAQGADGVAIGSQAGQDGQGAQAVAIGRTAGVADQGVEAIAIGDTAGATTQGNAAVAIGAYAGYNTQGLNAVAIGYGAGYNTQGVAAVAIGRGAGDTAQGDNSIIINATNTNLNQTTANTFTVKPVRNGGSAAGMAALGFRPTYYNPTTGEFVYSSS